MDTGGEHRERQLKQSRWGFRGITVRDWLPIVGALLIPVMIAAGTWAITWQQGKLEAQRAKAERELSEQRAQDEILQAYFEQMGTLLLEKDLRSATKDSEVRTLARARTLTVPGRLDPSRKQLVIQFLVEAGLVQSVEQSPPVIALAGADLSNTDLGGVRAQSAAVFRGANLDHANLHDAWLINAELEDANLSNSDLRNAHLPFAHLSDASLPYADLDDADLRWAELFDANLTGADLRNSNLIGADGVTKEQLARAKSLKGATMPNGQKYEDWIKDRESRKEDG